MIGDTDIKQLFARDFGELPIELKRAIEADSPLEKLLEIGRKNNLRIDQIGALGEIVNEFIFGYISAPGEFVSEIKTRLGTDGEKSGIIAREINTEIFLPIREALKKATTAPASPAPKPLPPIPPEPMEKAEPMIFPPGAANRVKKPMIEEAKPPAPTRMEDVKIPGPKADLNGKISPIISRLGIQRTANEGAGGQALGANAGIGNRAPGARNEAQGVRMELPIIEEVKQQKVIAAAPAAESLAPPSAKPSLYDEIKARAERELKELIEKEKTGASGEVQGVRSERQDIVEKKPTAQGVSPTTPTIQEMKLVPVPPPPVKSPPEQAPVAPKLAAEAPAPEQVLPAQKPTTPPTPGPLKLPQEKIPKPQAPERYSTDPYRESVE